MICRMDERTSSGRCDITWSNFVESSVIFGVRVRNTASDWWNHKVGSVIQKVGSLT